MKMVRMDVGNAWSDRAKTTVLAVWRWTARMLGAFLRAMFVPSDVDRQIEEGRERVRRLAMRS